MPDSTLDNDDFRAALFREANPLTDEEELRLVKLMLYSRAKHGGPNGETGATEEEVAELIGACRTLRFMNTCLDVALKGGFLVDLDEDGELVFRLTEAGEKRGAEMLDAFKQNYRSSRTTTYTPKSPE